MQYCMNLMNPLKRVTQSLQSFTPQVLNGSTKISIIVLLQKIITIY